MFAHHTAVRGQMALVVDVNRRLSVHRCMWLGQVSACEKLVSETFHMSLKDRWDQHKDNGDEKERNINGVDGKRNR